MPPPLLPNPRQRPVSAPHKHRTYDQVRQATNDRPSGSYSVKREDIPMINHNDSNYKDDFKKFIVPELGPYKYEFVPNRGFVVNRHDKDTHEYYDHGKLGVDKLKFNEDDYNKQYKNGYTVHTDYFHDMRNDFKQRNPYGKILESKNRPTIPSNHQWKMAPTNNNPQLLLTPTGGIRVIKPKKSTKTSKPTKGVKPKKPTKAAKPTKGGVKPKKPKAIKIRKPTKTLRTKKAAPRKLKV